MNTVAWQADECPSEQVLLDLTVGTLAPEPRRLAGRHISECLVCADSVAAALSFLNPAPALEATAPGLSAAAERETPVPERMTARRSLQPGQLLRDTYRIVRFIGSGAMGEVYEARHARLIGRYAIKILNLDLVSIENARARFRREAIASELRHPNIVQVIDFDETENGRPYLVLEFLHGQDLGATIGQAGRLPLQRALEIASQNAAGLGAMHRLGIVHRDLKPGNVVVLATEAGEPERIKLVDFGLSRRQVPSLAVTHDRALLGTPQYMAPEQARGESDSVGPAADQFAMALLLYEMLSGRPAFSGASLAAVLYQIVHEAPVPLQNLVPGLPIPVLNAIERALAKDPQARFPSVRDFADALTAAPEIPARTWSWGQAAAITACAAVAIAGTLWIRAGEQRPRQLVPTAVPTIPAALPSSSNATSPPESKAVGTLNAQVPDELPKPAFETRKKAPGRGVRAKLSGRAPEGLPPLPPEPKEESPAGVDSPKKSVSGNGTGNPDGAVPLVPDEPEVAPEPKVTHF